MNEEKDTEKWLKEKESESTEELQKEEAMKRDSRSTLKINGSLM